MLFSQFVIVVSEPASTCRAGHSIGNWNLALFWRDLLYEQRQLASGV